MKKFSVVLVSLILVLSAASSSFAFDPSLGQVNTARTMAMGEAVIAVSDDLSSPYFNPAALANIDRTLIGFSMSAALQKYDGKSDVLTSVQDNYMPLENLGVATKFGPGVVFLGYGASQNYFGTWHDIIGSGIDASLDSKTYTYTASYGMRISPALALGASLSYISRYDQTRIEDHTNSIPVSKICRGMGANLAALYTLSPQMNLGASLILTGPFAIEGRIDATDLGYYDYSISGATDNPSTLRFGGSYKPNKATTFGLQFDVINGVHMVERESGRSDSDYIDMNIETSSDTVIATRIGGEYVVSVPNAEVPIWAGAVFIPENRTRFGVDTTSLLPVIAFATINAGDVTWYNIPNTSIASLGIGYRTGMMELSLAAQWMAGSSRLKAIDQKPIDIYSVQEHKVIASALFKI